MTDLTDLKELADAIAWLERQKASGHCGEENSEIRARDRHNDRIDRILSSLRRVGEMEAALTGLLAQLSTHGVVLECMGRETPLIELLNTDRGYAAVLAARSALQPQGGEG